MAGLYEKLKNEEKILDSAPHLINEIYCQLQRQRIYLDSRTLRIHIINYHFCFGHSYFCSVRRKAGV